MIYIIGDSNRKINNELVSKARELSLDLKEEVSIIFIDSSMKDIHKNYDVDEIILLKNENFVNYDYESYSKALIEFLEDKDASIVLFSSNQRYREIAAILSVRIDRALLTDCTNIMIEEDSIVAIKPSLDGSSFSKYKFNGEHPYLILVKSVEVKKEVSNKKISEIKVIDSNYFNNENVKILDIEKDLNNVVDIKDADIIFAGGRGLLNEDSFLDLRKLAKEFNASIGGSRPTVDLGWARVDEQIGQTGSFVKPKVYIAFGISGAIQHIAGMGESEYIISVNNNRNSPIYKYSDYGVVADANSIIRNMLNILKEKNTNSL